MKVSECKLGEVVQHTTHYISIDLGAGHIVGCTQNSVGEFNAIIQWSNGEKGRYHTSKIKLYED